MIIRRLLAVEAVLLAGFGSIFLLPHSNKNMASGIAMSLPVMVNGWIGEDAGVTARELEVLAKDTQFARKTYMIGRERGDDIFVSIVMSGDDMTSSIHRPERCLPAQGWTVGRSEQQMLQVRGKPLQLTKLYNVQAIPQPDKSQALLHNLTYYWFIGAREMTPSHLTRTIIDMRDRILRGEAQRWAYVMVAINSGITKDGSHFGRTEEEAGKIAEQFIQELVPKLTQPDGKPLM
jgi:EpsI family protein